MPCIPCKIAQVKIIVDVYTLFVKTIIFLYFFPLRSVEVIDAFIFVYLPGQKIHTSSGSMVQHMITSTNPCLPVVEPNH